MLPALGVGSRPALRRTCSRRASLRARQVPSARPADEVVVDGPPGREVVRQGPPGAAVAVAVEDRIEDVAEVGLAGPPQVRGGREQRLEDAPTGHRSGRWDRAWFSSPFYVRIRIMEQTVRAAPGVQLHASRSWRIVRSAEPGRSGGPGSPPATSSPAPRQSASFIATASDGRGVADGGGTHPGPDMAPASRHTLTRAGA